MIGIGSTDVYIDISKFSREDLESYSKSLFLEWEVYVEKNLELSDYSLFLSVEDGSIKTLGRVGVGLYALYIGIGQYGSFISGLQTIRSQVNDVSDYLGQQAVAPFFEDRISPRVRKRGEALARLEGLFAKVKKGELSVEDAVQEAKNLFDEEADEVPAFFQELEESLLDNPEDISQSQLELDIGKEADDPRNIENATPSRTPRLPRVPQPPREHYRVEVWRDSRKDRVSIRVSRT